MGTASGWQADLSVHLQHYGRLLTDGLSWIPGWAAAILLVLVLVFLGRRALGQVAGTEERDSETLEEVESQEDVLEQRA
jgi:hypothetical protein